MAVWLGGGLAAALALSVGAIPLLRKGADSVRTGAVAAAPSEVTLLVYARRGADAPRLAAELPREAEGTWSREERLQLSARHVGPAFVYVVATDPSGGVQRYFPPPTGGPAIQGDGKLRLLVADLPVAERHAQGPVRLFAVFSPEPVAEEALLGAARTASGDLRSTKPLPLPGAQVTALFSLTP